MNNDNALLSIFKEGVKFYQSGNLTEAEKIFRQLLNLNPRHAHSLHMMAVIGFDVQRYDIAEELARKALAEQKNVAAFYFTLANILRKLEKPEEAVENYKIALKLKPDFIDALNNFGTTLISLDQIDEAEQIFQRIIAGEPRHFNALCNMGSIAYKRKEYQEALEYYRESLTINPQSANVHYDIGRCLKLLNKTEEALASFQLAVQYKPDYVDALINMGMICRDQGILFRNSNMMTAALSYFSRILSIRPEEDAYANIAYIYLHQKRYLECIAECKKGIQIFPESIKLLNNLGSVYDMIGEFEKALDYYNQALALSPDNKEIYSNIGSTLKNLGRQEEAIAAQKKALEIDSNQPWIYSNLLLTMVYAASVSPEELARMSRQFGERIADPLLRKRPFAKDKNPERKLRIGYVSPDFRNHAVSYFLAPVHNRDPEKFEIYAYSNAEMEDSVTDRLKKDFDHWRDIRFMSDDAVADLIESDNIDILVDIAGHTSRNSLMVFARKPAPIQVTWLGHPATTGMKAMDYRFTDSYAEPPGMTEHLNTETLWRLPEIFCCYQAHESNPAVIDHPPFEDNGYITFGCFNNFSKVTDPVLDTWAKIMAQVPDARLLLEIAGIDSEKIRSEIEERLRQHGLPLERVKLEPRRKSNQFVLYNKIDIALDPFPCPGGTTSMDTLWMGVPLVTLAGKHFVSRMGVTILTNAGLSELVTNSTDEYIYLAVELARDRKRLRKLRHNLRDRVIASPLMDQKKFTRNMEEAFREMWRKWCASEAGKD